MRVAIVGLGAIGQVVTRALTGRVELLGIDRTRQPLGEDERPAPVDLAIVCTKTPGTRWAARQAARVLAPDGLALTIQNGLGNAEVLAGEVGPGRVSVGVIYVGARIRPDGSLFATGPGKIELGEDPRLDGLADALRAGSMTVIRSADTRASVWRKLLVNAAMNPTSAVFGLTNGELVGHPAAGPLADGIAREVARVATASGVPIGEADGVAAWREIAALLGDNRSSMLQDVDAGRVTEVLAINGAVARAGESAGVDAPLNRAFTVLMTALQPAES